MGFLKESNRYTPAMQDALHTQILEFWFGTIDAEGNVAPETQTRWWKKSSEFDARCREQFLVPLQAAANGELQAPKRPAQSVLAYIVLCDQLSRNIFRDTPRAFATDPLALAATLELIESGLLDMLRPVEKSFALMPLMHSEKPSIQELSIAHFSVLKEEGKDNLDFALRHKAIIDRFGRYPHRNAILGRESTPEEVEFLRQPGSSF